MLKKLLFPFTVFLLVHPVFSQEIKLNQSGFYPEAEKLAVVPTALAGECMLVNESGDTLQTFPLSPSQTWSFSGETVSICDFSSFTSPGRYKLVVDGVGESYLFDIRSSVHLGLVKGILRGFYYQRASTEITEPYAGVFTRASGHPDTVVYVHASAASDTRPEGTRISSPKGWYDAGDFNKYIINSGITTFTVLSLYEHYPAYFDSLSLKIPESNNNLPDILDEVLWNVEWMLTMQDPSDGGVYHKLTSKNFTGTIMPSEDGTERYVVQKTTAAALDFAAVMAVSARIFKKFEAVKPGFSQQCLDAAISAWNWAKLNPSVYYSQPADIYTGVYGDNSVGDEFDWASAELFISTGDVAYLLSEGVLSSPINVPDWRSVSGLSWVSLALHIDSLSSTDSTTVANKVLTYGNHLFNTYSTSAYRVVMGNNSADFRWGSNSVAGNQGMMLLQAYQINGDEKYLKAALANQDYIMGRNATGYSFVTAYGSNSSKNIHHRISSADAIPGPIPGLLAGGPQAGQEDNCSYTSDLPALSYSDTYCSYSTNEIAINWNAPLAYVSGAIEAIINGRSSGPAILMHPQDQEAQEGMPASFDVFASGTNLLYQWQKEGANIQDADSSSFSIVSASLQDEGSYRVLVISGADTVISRNVSFKLLVKGPFGGVRDTIPGRVEAEDYDEGGEGLGYSDRTSGNSGGGYRYDAVDVEATSDIGGGFNVGWIDANEWLNYSVYVKSTGNYLIEFRLASVNASGSTGNFTFLIDGVSVAGTVIPPSTGGWQAYKSVMVEDIALSEGDHDFRINFGAPGFNINYFRLVDMDNCEASSEGTFNIDCGTCKPATVSCLDIDGQSSSSIRVYPNPSQSTFTINLKAVKPGTLFILNSADGKEILKTEIYSSQFTFGEKLDKGLYFGRIIYHDKVQVFEVIKN